MFFVLVPSVFEIVVTYSQKTGATRRRVGLAACACLILTASEAASVSSAAVMTGNDSTQQNQRCQLPISVP